MTVCYMRDLPFFVRILNTSNCISSGLRRGECNPVSSDVVLVGAAPLGTMLNRHSNFLVPHTRTKYFASTPPVINGSASAQAAAVALVDDAGAGASGLVLC